MPISFRCRRCRTPLSVSSREAGNPFICPACRGEQLVPSASEMDPAQAPVTTPPPAPEARPVPQPAVPASPPGARARLPRVAVGGVAGVVLLLTVTAAGAAAYRAWFHGGAVTPSDTLGGFFAPGDAGTQALRLPPPDGCLKSIELSGD